MATVYQILTAGGQLFQSHLYAISHSFKFRIEVRTLIKLILHFRNKVVKLSNVRVGKTPLVINNA
jgi:hypothetical protein